MYIKIVPEVWMQAPQALRNQIALDFGLTRTGASEIYGDELIKDGFSVEDLAPLTEEAMAEYVGSMETLPRLWELTVAKAYSILNPITGIIETKDEKPTNKKNK